MRGERDAMRIWAVWLQIEVGCFLTHPCTVMKLFVVLELSVNSRARADYSEL